MIKRVPSDSKWMAPQQLVKQLGIDNNKVLG